MTENSIGKVKKQVLEFAAFMPLFAGTICFLGGLYLYSFILSGVSLLCCEYLNSKNIKTEFINFLRVVSIVLMGLIALFYLISLIRLIPQIDDPRYIFDALYN